MKQLKQYEKSILDMIEKFIDKYYTYDDGSRADDYYLIWDSFEWPLNVNDDYRSIDEIYLALKNDFEFDKMVKYKEMEIELYPKRPDINFYNFCKYYDTNPNS